MLIYLFYEGRIRPGLVAAVEVSDVIYKLALNEMFLLPLVFHLKCIYGSFHNNTDLVQRSHRL